MLQFIVLDGIIQDCEGKVSVTADDKKQNMEDIMTFMHLQEKKKRGKDERS